MILRLHHPFKLNEFKDWFLINVGFRVHNKHKGFFIVICNFGFELYAES